MRTLFLVCFAAITVVATAGCGGTSRNTHVAVLDAGVDSGTQQGMPDLSMSQSTKPDLSMAAGQGGCAAALNCINQCTDPNAQMQCIAACKAQTTTQGWNLLISLFDCIFGGQNGSPMGACPSATGGICDNTAANYNATSCNNCVSQSQMQGGACYSADQACSNDM